ncbi:hypothetical protein NOF04DRAFT_1281563 [Fusarium oxysporum II5]|nr:hypothetical protein NOF04DRAFT_1281563 [Fusarium oxysporum II5]
MPNMDMPLCYFCNLLTTSSAQSSSASIYAEYELKTLTKDWKKLELQIRQRNVFVYFLYCSPNSLDVTTLPDPSNSIRDPQVAVFPDTLGSIAIARITAWIKECIDNHGTCQQQDTEFLSTRFLDVGIKDTDVVKLMEPREKVEYVALSHCWGSPTPS